MLPIPSKPARRAIYAVRRVAAAGFFALVMVSSVMAPAARAQDSDGPVAPGDRVTDPYEGAMKMMAKGNYTEALKILKAIATQTPDSEVALLQIGHCYFHLAETAPNAEAAQRNTDIGLGWVIEAADSGLRDAQEELVRLYLDGRILTTDPTEAGKWYLIWRENRNDIAFGIPEFNRALQQRLTMTLSQADWTEAKKRVKEWNQDLIAAATQQIQQAAAKRRRPPQH